MNKKLSKTIVLLIAVVALLAVSVSGTLAYLITSTNSIVNVFTPAIESTEIKEEFNGTSKSSVKIENTGNIPVYVRVKVIANWYKDGKIVAPWTDNVSYDMSNWTKIEDYYYYKDVLSANSETANLFLSPYTYKQEDVPVEGAHLEMTILHQSIQAEPTTAVHDAWGVTVGSDGKISK